MAYIKNFEKPETKHNRLSQTFKSNNDPWDNPTVKPKTSGQEDFFKKHIKQYTELISWARWYPDLFLDLIKPKTGGINLHFDQRVYLRSICRFVSVYGVFPRGWGKCVSGNTYLFTDKGVVPIRDFFDCEENGIEDYTKKIDMAIVNKNQEHEKIDRGVYNGYKNTKKIKTMYGYELECSDNHPIMIQKQNGEIDFVLASDLKVGDKVLISTKNDIWGDNLDIKTFNVPSKTKRLNCAKFSINQLDEDIAKFLGYFLAAGVIIDDNQVFFYHKDDYVVKEYVKLLNELGFEGKCKKTRKSNKVSFMREYFGFWLEGLGYGYKESGRKKIPACIMSAPKKIVASFLQGLFEAGAIIETENGRVSMTTKSKDLAEQVHLLLLNFGIISSLRQRKFKNKSGIYYCLKIHGENIDKFKEEINFASMSKRRKLTNICRYYRYINVKKYKDDYFLDKIEEIEDGKEHVYDISVPDTHSFVSNGFISHNTWGEVISMFIIAVLYPGITMALTAQTKANAAELLKDKYDEITRQYPLLKNEMLKPRVSKDDFELSFTNGSRIDVLANAQTSKGQRRNRIQIEESALIDNTTFEDALKPIVEIGRTTQGKLGIPDPQELNQNISFYTTSG